MDLSIIVPVYNVEKYVRSCIESIFQQGLEESRFEVIIVNDGSTDKSMEVIADIIEQHSNISVINQENLSLSVARNNGMAKAKGEYIFMPDSDDLLIKNSLLPLLEIALEKKVDLVVANFLSIKNEEIASFPGIVQEKFTYQEKTGGQLLIENLNPYQCFVWRTLYRRKFILDNHISFIPGINYQDVPFTHECCLKAQQCIFTPWYLYIYRHSRPGAATTYFNVKKSRSYCIAIGSTWKLAQMPSLSPEVRYKIEENVFRSFSAMVYHTIHSVKKPSERKQILDILRTEAPDLNFKHGIRQKLTTFMLRRMPIIFIEIYWFYAQIKYRKRNPFTR